MGCGNESLFAGLGHMTKMAATPIYGKKRFKNLLLQNQRANDRVAWYEALGSWAHQFVQMMTLG